MILAQATSVLPAPGLSESIGWFFITLAAIAAGLNQLSALWHRHKDKPTGGEALAQVFEKFATKEDLEKVESEFKRHIEAERLEAAERRKGIYGKIDKSREEVLQRVDDTRKELDEKIKGVHSRVDTIPDRIFAMLNNTKD